MDAEKWVDCGGFVRRGLQDLEDGFPSPGVVAEGTWDGTKRRRGDLEPEEKMNQSERASVASVCLPALHHPASLRWLLTLEDTNVRSGIRR